MKSFKVPEKHRIVPKPKAPAAPKEDAGITGINQFIIWAMHLQGDYICLTVLFVHVDVGSVCFQWWMVVLNSTLYYKQHCLCLFSKTHCNVVDKVLHLNILFLLPSHLTHIFLKFLKFLRKQFLKAKHLSLCLKKWKLLQ